MTARALFQTVTRLLALWCWVTAVSALASVPALDWGEPGEFRQTQAISVASLVLVPVLFGLLLWVGSGWLARRATPSEGESVSVSLDAGQLFALGTSLLGLAVIVLVLPEFAQAGAFAIALHLLGTLGEPMDSTFELQRWVYRQAGIARLISLTTRLALGMVLLLGPRYVGRLIRTFAERTFGSRLLEEEPDK